MSVADRLDAGRVAVIAEAGVNHDGRLDLALELVDAAAASGADAVKFQTFSADKVMTAVAPKAAYQKVTTGADETQLEMVRRLELDDAAHRAIVERCARVGIEFMSSAGDVDSLRYLLGLGVETVKVPSGDLRDLPYLRVAGASGRTVLLSTGMGTLAEVEEALAAIVEAGSDRSSVIVLQCVTEYPAPPGSANLRAMVQMRDALGVRVGLSDHTVGDVVSAAAVALGACVIEKHFTLDRTSVGPDHAASLEPADFRRLVESVRTVEEALGDGVKRPADAERANRDIVRKSIVAAHPIRRGRVLQEADLAVKRPAGGIDPMRWDEVVGSTAPRDFDTDEMIEI